MTGRLQTVPRIRLHNGRMRSAEERVARPRRPRAGLNHIGLVAHYPHSCRCGCGCGCGTIQRGMHHLVNSTLTRPYVNVRYRRWSLANTTLTPV